MSETFLTPNLLNYRKCCTSLCCGYCGGAPIPYVQVTILNLPHPYFYTRRGNFSCKFISSRDGPVKVEMKSHKSTHPTVEQSCSYHKALIFCGFCKLAFIHEINFQQKLIHRHVICIFTYFVRPVHKMSLYKYLKNTPSAQLSLGSNAAGSHFFNKT